VCGTGTSALGQSYWVSADYCAAVGTPGTDSTYTQAMAAAAAAAGPQPDATLCTNLSGCTGVTTCTTSTTAQDAVFSDLRDTGGPCIVWTYKTTGSGSTQAPSGHVYMNSLTCYCPISTDPTWD
jgi:hypothetical protein